MGTRYHNLTRYEAMASALPMTGGKVFFVSASGDAWFERLQRLFPVDIDGEVRLFTNLDTAVGACTANRGDVILVLPNFSQTITAAAGINLDVAGITVLGIGNGAGRPLISFSTAVTATLAVGAANVTLDNFLIDVTGFDNITQGIDVNAASFTLRNSRVILADSDGQAALGLVNDSGGDHMVIENCIFQGDTSEGTTAQVRVIGGNGHRIVGNHFFGNPGDSRGLLEFVTTAPTNVIVRNNFFNTLPGDSVSYGILGVAAAHGEIAYNEFRVGNDTNVLTTGAINTPGNFIEVENYQAISARRGRLTGTAM